MHRDTDLLDEERWYFSTRTCPDKRRANGVTCVLEEALHGDGLRHVAAPFSLDNE
jgi:hypothetical protein